MPAKPQLSTIVPGASCWAWLRNTIMWCEPGVICDDQLFTARSVVFGVWKYQHFVTSSPGCSVMSGDTSWNPSAGGSIVSSPGGVSSAGGLSSPVLEPPQATRNNKLASQ